MRRAAQKKFDIREKYFVKCFSAEFNLTRFLTSPRRLSAKPEEDWDMKRVPRPKGTPEWGVLPPERAINCECAMNLPPKDK
jgi:cytochrome c oxidase assembly protein subunit 16